MGSIIFGDQQAIILKKRASNLTFLMQVRSWFSPCKTGISQMGIGLQYVICERKSTIKIEWNYAKMNLLC